MSEVSPQGIIVVALFALLYAWGSFKLKRRPTSRQLVAYLCGVVLLYGTMSGPIDHYALAGSFSLYIIQEMMLVFVVPPLILLGVPDWMARPLVMNRWVERPWRFLTRPVMAFIVFSALFTFIHYPPVCDRICHLRTPYGDVRDILLFVSFMLWWPLLSPLPEYPRLSYPIQILYLFLLTIPITAVAAPITFASSVLYTFFKASPHPFGLTPMADQVLGGVILWVGQGAYLMCIFTVIFFRWSRLEEEREVPVANLRRPPDLRVLNRAGRAGV